jgi:hypothetical protein
MSQKSYKVPGGGSLRRHDSDPVNGVFSYDFYTSSGKRVRKTTRTRNLDAAMAVAIKIRSGSSINERGMRLFTPDGTYISNMLKRTRRNAKARGFAFNLIDSDVCNMFERQDYKCDVTGIPFHETVAHTKYRMSPFMPSIDRISSEDDYRIDNCRLVCVAANYAMNIWGEWVLKEMVASMIANGEYR